MLIINDDNSLMNIK